MSAAEKPQPRHNVVVNENDFVVLIKVPCVWKKCSIQDRTAMHLAVENAVLMIAAAVPEAARE